MIVAPPVIVIEQPFPTDIDVPLVFKIVLSLIVVVPVDEAEPPVTNTSDFTSVFEILTVPWAWSNLIPLKASSNPPSTVILPLSAFASITPIASLKIDSASILFLAFFSSSSNSGCI